MGLGRLLTGVAQARSTQYVATDLTTGASATYVVVDNIAPNFVSNGAGAYQGAMAIPGAWRASRLLSSLMGRIPWSAFRKIAGRDEEEITPTPPLLDQPNPPFTRFTTFSGWALDYVWHGNAVGLIAARGTGGWPTAVVPVPATSVMIRRVGENEFDQPLAPGTIEYRVGAMRGLTSQDVIHIMGPAAPGELRGMGVLEAQLETLNRARDEARQAGNVVNHGVPTGVLQSEDPDLDDDEAADLKTAWMRSQTTRTVAVLNGMTTFTPLAWNPEQMQLIQARKYTLGELELIFGLPVGWLGGERPSMTYTNIESEGINLLRFSLGEHVAQFEQTFTLKLPRGTIARGNLDFLLRGDTLTRYQAHEIALRAGFLTVDEVREYEHRPPLPEKPLQSDQFVSGPPSEAEGA